MPKLLIVDDEAGYREVLKAIFEDEGYSVATAGDGRSALAHLEANNCDLSAIPAEQRPAHIARAQTLLYGDRTAVHELPDGYQFELPAEHFAEVAGFIENERRCCRHLAFVLEVPPRSAPISLRITGPGARDDLDALAGLVPNAEEMPR